MCTRWGTVYRRDEGPSRKKKVSPSAVETVVLRIGECGRLSRHLASPLPSSLPCMYSILPIPLATVQYSILRPRDLPRWRSFRVLHPLSDIYPRPWFTLYRHGWIWWSLTSFPRVPRVPYPKAKAEPRRLHGDSICISLSIISTGFERNSGLRRGVMS